MLVSETLTNPVPSLGGLPCGEMKSGVFPGGLEGRSKFSVPFHISLLSWDREGYTE